MTGYVKNLPDGTVEMLLQGTASDLRKCLHEIEVYFQAYISDIHPTERAVDPTYTDFSIRY